MYENILEFHFWPLLNLGHIFIVFFFATPEISRSFLFQHLEFNQAFQASWDVGRWRVITRRHSFDESQLAVFRQESLLVGRGHLVNHSPLHLVLDGSRAIPDVVAVGQNVQNLRKKENSFYVHSYSV